MPEYEWSEYAWATTVSVAAAATQPPTVLIEINTGSWQDVYPWLRSFSFSRGRSRPLERVGPGTATFVFDNREGTFDRDNPESIFYPNIRPALPIRLLASVDTNTTAFQIGGSQLGGGEAFGGGEPTTSRCSPAGPRAGRWHSSRARTRT